METINNCIIILNFIFSKKIVGNAGMWRNWFTPNPVIELKFNLKILKFEIQFSFFKFYGTCIMHCASMPIKAAMQTDVGVPSSSCEPTSRWWDGSHENYASRLVNRLSNSPYRTRTDSLNISLSSRGTNYDV